MTIFNPDGSTLAEIIVDDNSYRNRAIMGDHNVTLHYALPEHLEIPIGAYCEFEGERYTLMRPEQIKMKHRRLYEYTVTFSSEQDKAKIWKFRNLVDGRLKFTLTATPKEHLQMFVENMNRHDKGWTVGECIDDVEKLISYDHDYCWDALTKQATEFKTEFEIDRKRVSLHKVEYNKSNPLPLSYGRGNGFKSGIGRSNSGDTMPTEILFVQGGERNIDRSKYPEDDTLRATSNGCLLLPVGQSIGYDGEHFENEEGYKPESARHYVVDNLGLSIRNMDKDITTGAEDSLDRSDDYPKRIGTINSVVEVDKEKNFYDFIDNSIPQDLNYEEYLIGEEQMTVIFQSGELASREFDVKYYHEPKTMNGTRKAGRRFEIVPQEIDGVMMPGGTFVPRKGDKYAVFNVMLPGSYIRNDKGKSGASWDMFKAATKYLFDNEQQKYTFTGELDGLWAKRDWVNIGGRIRLGGFVRFTNEQFEKDGVLIRITSIKDYINNPHSPKIELSNETISGSVSSTIKQLESTEVIIDENHRSALQFTKRRFRDAKETIGMIENALLENFTNSINPITVQTMSMLVGDESLQFRFVESLTNPVQVNDTVKWDNTKKRLTIEASVIQHLTLGIKEISSDHEGKYKMWSLPPFTSAVMIEGTKKYYLYAKCSMENQTGEFLLSEKAIKMETGGYIYLLVGVVNSEYDGERSYVPLYGFTEILPGRITTDKIVSGSGISYFDMLNNAMKLGDALDFNSRGDGKLRLKGTIVQSQSGKEDVIGCYRGAFSFNSTYYRGDVVTYAGHTNNPVSTYRHISETPTKGIAPTNTNAWEIIAEGAKGDKGENGSDGKDGASPAMVYRGMYDNSKTYYGTDARRDCVKYGLMYYITKTDAGEFAKVLPTDKSKWEEFGASFESVATELLLAELAYIKNLGVCNLQTAQSGKRVHISADDNAMTIYDADGHTSAIFSGDQFEDNELFGGTNISVTPTMANKSYKTGYALHPNMTFKDTIPCAQFSSNYPGVFQGNCKITIVSTGNVSYRQAFRARAGLYLDNVFLGSVEISNIPAETPVDINISRGISAGSHQLLIKVEIDNPNYSGNDSYEVRVAATFDNCKVLGNVRMARYFANGQAIGASATEYIETLVVNGQLRHRLINGNSGIEFMEGTMRIRLGGQWYTASRDANGVLKLD